jgi:lipid-binding SYLF domain-containing protein
MKISSITKKEMLICAMATAAALFTGCASPTMSQSTAPHTYTESTLSSDARAALAKITADKPAAATLENEAKGILVFPAVIKAGFVVGAFHGEGVLLKQGKIAGYYNTGGGSYGLQAGVQQYGYALFFMSESALRYMDQSDGWEIGVGPSVVVVDEGVGRSLTTTTARSDVYAFIFDQKGLMAGMGLQGSKISRIR